MELDMYGLQKKLENAKEGKARNQQNRKSKCQRWPQVERLLPKFIPRRSVVRVDMNGTKNGSHNRNDHSQNNNW